jgi:glutamate-1-semialdehyde aminotransferase
VYLPPSAFEAAFTSAAHGDEEMEVLEHALARAFGHEGLVRS